VTIRKLLGIALVASGLAACGQDAPPTEPQEAPPAEEAPPDLIIPENE
jgi:predicted small lipoprotein YifL